MRSFVLLPLLLVAACSTEDDPAGYDPDYCPKVADWEPAWAALEDEVVALVNDRRSEGGVCGGEAFAPSAPLAVDAALQCAARNHSLDMATRGYFDHTSQDGEEFSERFARAGFEGSFIGENIAKGPRTADEVMSGWMASAGHCTNILHPDFEFLGVGHHGGDAIWTQTFGAK
jgi:uncharacterized protein YkwD